MSDDQHDPLPAMLASLDQALAMAPQIARIYRAMYDAFVAEGFTESQALWLAFAQVNASAGDPPTD